MFKKKENKENKPEVSIEKTKKKVNASNIFFVLLSLGLTFAVFIGLIVLENRLSGKTIYKKVVTAKNDVPKGLFVTEENINTYFQVTDIDIRNDIAESLQSPDILLGMRTVVPLYSGEIVLTKDFDDIDSLIAEIEHPVQVAVETSSLSDIAGGIIREGDWVNIIVARSATPEEYAKTGYKYITRYVMEQVYVSAAMDSNGKRIDSHNTSENASLLIFTMKQTDELILSDALANSSMVRISKIVP